MTLEEGMREILRPLVVDVVGEELDRRFARRTEWLTVEEYAARKRTTPAAVHKRLERGRIVGAEREGRRWLIPVAAAAANLPDTDNEGRAPR